MSLVEIRMYSWMRAVKKIIDGCISRNVRSE